MEKEKQQDNPKMSKLKKILFAAVFAVVSVTTCGCEYVAGYRTYPRYHYEYRSPLIHPPPRYYYEYRSPIIHPPYYRDSPRYDHRYREYNPHSPQLRISPNIQRPCINYPTPHRNPSANSRPERHRK